MSVTQNQTAPTLFSLALPMVIENFMRQLVGTVNVFILGHYSDGAATAVGVANQLVNLFLQVFTLTAAGAASAISQYIGAGEQKKALRLSSIVFYLFTFCGILLSVLLFALAIPLLKLMNLDSSLLPQGASYLRLAGGALFLQVIVAALSGISRSYGNSKPAMTATLIMNVCNVIGSYLVVFRPFEIPLRGVTGVGCVLVFSEAVAACYMLWYVFGKMKIGMRLSHLSGKIFQEIKIIFRYGVPSAVESLTYNMSLLVSTSFVGLLGAAAMSARVYIVSIINFSYLVGVSVGQGVQILIGRYIGAKDYESVHQIHRKAYFLMLPANLSIALIFALLRFPILRLFTSDPEIIAIAAPILIFDLLVQCGRTIGHVSLYSLRGAGDVRFSMIISVLSMLIVNLGIGYLCAIVLNMGLIGIWIGFAVDEWCRALIITCRWNSGKWKNMSVI